MIPKSLRDVASFVRLGLNRALKLWEKYNPTAALEAILRKAFRPPQSGPGPSPASIALTAALGAVAVVGVAAVAGIVPPAGLAVHLAGATCFTLLNPFFAGLHAEVANELVILGIIAPVALGIVNILCLRSMPKIPEGFVKAVLHCLDILKHAAVSVMRMCTALKNYRFWRRRAAT